MKAFLLVLVLCQLYASFAQEVPVLPETFVGSGDVEVHKPDMTGFGEFTIARNEALKMGMEKEIYDVVGKDEISEALYRYDLNLTYYVRGDAQEPHCVIEDRNFTGMPEYWYWLKYANYEGIEKVREMDYDLWGLNIGGVRYEFGKPVDNSTIIYTYRRKTAEQSVYYSFTKFSTTPPTTDMFSVPEGCRDSKKKN